MRTFRTFVGIPLPRPAARAAAALIGDVPGVRWVPKDNLYLTLKFLGEVDNVDVPTICDAAELAGDPVPSFSVTLQAPAAFPHRDRPRSLGLAIDDPDQGLTQLVAGLEQHYADIGFKREPRDYVPSLILGRARGGSRRLPDDTVRDWVRQPNFRPVPMRIGGMTVTASFVDSDAIRYQTLHRIDL